MFQLHTHTHAQQAFSCISIASHTLHYVFFEIRPLSLCFDFGIRSHLCPYLHGLRLCQHFRPCHRRCIQAISYYIHTTHLTYIPAQWPCVCPCVCLLIRPGVQAHKHVCVHIYMYAYTYIWIYTLSILCILSYPTVCMSVFFQLRHLSRGLCLYLSYLLSLQPTPLPPLPLPLPSPLHSHNFLCVPLYLLVHTYIEGVLVQLTHRAIGFNFSQ